MSDTQQRLEQKRTIICNSPLLFQSLTGLVHSVLNPYHKKHTRNQHSKAKSGDQQLSAALFVQHDCSDDGGNDHVLLGNDKGVDQTV